ncbi:hypothetical protein ACEV8A_24815 [Vibrio parahaemolyticus]|uniref:hypothetical protein n=1 Tax=Vibrio parahaemolyticus TaxID=670 RepID=UPI000465A5FC|nr:hypothetical protein [Vibrio parahaemolyticus]EJG1189257.1 hypothetical protein [Vibrio parahaemolyticus]MBE3856409.1 hypothetical protein [Vibrio parahaemolyticus]MBE4801749.1 hypothetical protein [Vibrio parahaemolyticus]MDF5005104.1 hypothetical protein [Vibrio parahaemolyticus]OKY33680.1 hypothetical protein BT101_25695 [Vibrio parahaemolyticus]
MEENVIVALISVGIGWLLAQLTDAIKKVHQQRTLKRALKAELSDIKRNADVAIELCVNFRENVSNTQYGVITPHSIKTHVFDNFYPTIYADFDPEERYAIAKIYGHVEFFNNALSSICQENVRNSFGDMFSALLWLQACINQYENDPKKQISDDNVEVERVNKEVLGYLKAVGLLG